MKLISKSEMTILTPNVTIGDRVAMAIFYIIFAIAWLVIGIIRILGRVGIWIVQYREGRNKVDRSYNL